MRSSRRTAFALIATVVVVASAAGVIWWIHSSKRPLDAATLFGGYLAPMGIALAMLMPLGAWWWKGRSGAGAQASTPEQAAAGGLPVAVPLGRLPAEVRGRDALLAELRRPLTRCSRRRGRSWILAGMGGLGKSTVALATAETAHSRGWRVWWLTATDTASLSGGMLEVLHQLGAPESVSRPVREGAPTAAERTWDFLNGTHAAGRRWLLIFDNTDTPAVLAAPGTASPADYAGWLRPDPVGMVIVTTRTKDPRVWGPRVALRELRPLDDSTAAQVLADLAPTIVDPMGDQAEELGRRLGGLPLALYLAGSYLASPFARWRSFADYRQALDGVDLPAALADIDDPGADARATIQRTWDLSLAALDADGRPQARPLMLLLSCYAPATPIPAAMLRLQPLAGLLMPVGQAGAGEFNDAELDRRLRDGLRGLAAIALLEITDGNNQTRAWAVTVHPVVADANRSRLLTTARSELPAIGQAAVALLQTAGELEYERPADWPAWQLIIPHVTAVLEWLAAHLDDCALTTLLGISDRAADALWRIGDYAGAIRLARSSMNAAAGLGNDHPANLNARQAFAAKIVGQGRYRESEQLYRQVLSAQQRVMGDNHPDTLKTRHRLAWPVGEQGRYCESEQLYRQLLPDQQRILGSDHPDTLNARHNLARAVGLQGRYREAEQLFLLVLPDRQRVLGADHPDTLTTRLNLVEVIGLQGRYQEAEHLCRLLLIDQLRVLGADHPSTLWTHHLLAQMIVSQGGYRKAKKLYRLLLIDRRRVLGDDHFATLVTRADLARVVGLQGRYREAEKLCRTTLADEQRVLGGDYPTTLSTRHTLAWTIAKQGRYEEAEQLYRQVLTEWQRLLGPDHPSTLTTRQDLAWVTGRLGRYGEAEQMYRQVLTDRERVLGDQHPDTQASQRELTQLIALRAKTVE